MKKFVLFVCLFPYLSFAQQSTNHFSKVFGSGLPTVESLRAASPTLDSMYIYQGKENRLTSIEYYTYDASGRLIKQEGKTAGGPDGDLFLTSKTEYSFSESQEAGRNETEEQIYVYDNGQWLPVYKVFNGYAAATGTQVYMRSFLNQNGEWKKDWTWEAVEYTDEGFPSLVMDSTFNHDGSIEVMRMEASYNSLNLPAEGLTYSQDMETGKWLPMQRDRLEYNEQGKMLRQYAELMEDGQWEFGFEYTYQYDERGNMTHETDREADGSVFLIRNQNFYSDRIVTHNQTLRADPDYTVRMNPTSRVLQVDLGEATEGRITIINAAGTTVYQQTIHSSFSNFSLDSFSTGFYIIHIYTPAGEASHRVIIR